MLTSEYLGRSVTCPISFTDAEIEECLRISAAQDNIDEKLEILRGRSGVSKDGWVPFERYDNAVAENTVLKEELLAEAMDAERTEVLQVWLFINHSEDGFS